jgi:PAS domain S-box-containing protein
VEPGRAWACVVIGLALSAAGRAAGTGVVGVACLLAYPLAAYGVFHLVRATTTGAAAAVLLDAGVVASATAVFLASPFGPDRAPGEAITTSTVRWGSPILAVAVLAMATHLSPRTAWRCRALWLLLGSLALVLAGDVVGVWLTDAADSPPVWLVPMWVTPVLLALAAARHPSAAELTEPTSHPGPPLSALRLLPLAPALLALPLDPELLRSEVLDRPSTWFRLGARVALCAFVVGRVHLIVQSNRRRQDDVEAARARLSAVVDGAPAGMVFGGADERIWHVNPAAEALFGWAPGEIVGRHYSEVIGPDFLTHAEIAIDRLQQGQGFEQIVQGTRPDGNRFLASLRASTTYDSDGRAGGWVVVARDITEGIVTEEALRSLAADLDPEKAFARLAASLRRVVAFRTLSLTALEDDGRRYREIVTIGRRPTRATTRSGRLPPSVYEWLCQDPDGDVVVSRPGHGPDELASELAHWNLGAALTIPIARDDVVIATVTLGFADETTVTPQVLDIVGAIRPILVRAVRTMLLVERERVATRRARELEVARGDFLRMVSHDLGAPLAAVRAAAEVLLERSADLPPERRERLLAGILHSTESLFRLVDDMADASRIVDGRFPCRLARIERPDELVRRTVSALAAGDHLLAVETEACGPIVGDDGRLRQVIMNLVTNALKFSPPGTAVTVRLWEEAGELRLAVADEGPGIDPADVARLFERFTRLVADDGSAPEGTGLGLFITRGIVASHGGRIWVESTPGQGATFHVAIPRATALEPAVSAP